MMQYKIPQTLALVYINEAHYSCASNYSKNVCN